VKRQKKELPSMEVSLFCQQTVMILQSGIPLYDGMEVLYRNYEKTEYGAVFEGICAHVREGGSLHEGLKQSELFPDYMCYMVQVGEMTGKLEEVLEALGSYYEREDKIQNSVRSAVLYPLVLTVMMAVVIAILVIRILPVFSQVFQSLGTDLSGMAGTLLSGGVLLGRAVLVVVGVLLAAALVLYLLWSFGGRDVLLRMAGSICLPVRRLMEKPDRYGLTSDDVASMGMASALHDIGKIGIPDAILLKPGKLTDEEFEKMKEHTTIGCEMLEKSYRDHSSDFYQYCYNICRHHHERWNGRGYPDHLAGNDIPICAQIVAVADVYDALVNPRVYKAAFSNEVAYDMIWNGECGQFSPDIMECFRLAKEDFFHMNENLSHS